MTSLSLQEESEVSSDDDVRLKIHAPVQIDNTAMSYISSIGEDDFIIQIATQCSEEITYNNDIPYVNLTSGVSEEFISNLNKQILDIVYDKHATTDWFNKELTRTVIEEFYQPLDWRNLNVRIDTRNSVPIIVLIETPQDVSQQMDEDDELNEYIINDISELQGKDILYNVHVNNLTFGSQKFYCELILNSIEVSASLLDDDDSSIDGSVDGSAMCELNEEVEQQLPDDGPTDLYQLISNNKAHTLTTTTSATTAAHNVADTPAVVADAEIDEPVSDATTTPTGESTTVDAAAAGATATEDTANTKDTATEDTATEDTATKDTATKDTATEDTATKDTATKDTAAEDTASKNASGEADRDVSQEYENRLQHLLSNMEHEVENAMQRKKDIELEYRRILDLKRQHDNTTNQQSSIGTVQPLSNTNEVI